MRVDVRDAVVIGGLSPFDVAAYLRASGWTEARTEAGRFAIWTHDGENAEEVLLPLDRGLRDYAIRIGEVLSLLQRLESRSELEILNDLSTVSADVFRVRVEAADLASGSVPMEEGVALVEKARDLLLAAASAAIEPRAVYGPKRAVRALDYVKRSRLGQTERGSYVITVISRVPPALEHVGEIANLVEPFERNVMVTLARAVAATQNAAERAALRGDFTAFRERVRDGISANLCDALVGMAGGVDARHGLQFDFTWSRSRPLQQHDVPMAVPLPSEFVPVVAEAARIFRETTPRDDFELIGPVVRLERREPGGGGATILGFVEDSPRHVRLNLEEAEYEIAVNAHRDQHTVAVTGTLARDGRAWVLRAPHDLRVFNDDVPANGGLDGL